MNSLPDPAEVANMVFGPEVEPEPMVINSTGTRIKHLIELQDMVRRARNYQTAELDGALVDPDTGTPVRQVSYQGIPAYVVKGQVFAADLFEPKPLEQ